MPTYDFHYCISRLKDSLEYVHVDQQEGLKFARMWTDRALESHEADLQNSAETTESNDIATWLTEAIEQDAEVKDFERTRRDIIESGYPI